MATHQKQKRCHYCGRFFTPDYRHRHRQKSCKRDSCRKRRKKESQDQWVLKNPDYFKGRYSSTQRWRETHPDYQQEYRERQRIKTVSEIQDSCTGLTPMKSVRFMIPAVWLKSEIQDTMVCLIYLGKGTYIVTAGGGEIQDAWKKA